MTEIVDILRQRFPFQYSLTMFNHCDTPRELDSTTRVGFKPLPSFASAQAGVNDGIKERRQDDAWGLERLDYGTSYGCVITFIIPNSKWPGE